MPEKEMPRITLRPISQGDRDACIEICRECSCCPSRYDFEECAESVWLGMLSSKDPVLVIVDDASSEVIGCCNTSHSGSELSEIGIDLKVDSRGKGIGAPALGMAAQQFGEMLGRKRFKAQVDPLNVSSQRIMHKLGAVPAGMVLMKLFDGEEAALDSTIEQLKRIVGDLPEDNAGGIFQE